MSYSASDPAVKPLGFIRRLLASESYLLRDHLLRLDPEARHRRFGHDVADEFISRYAARAGEYGNITYGYFVDGNVRAVAELRPGALMRDGSAEAAFSVEGPYTNQGIATQLMGRIIRTARNRGLRHLILICLPDNAKMRAIAKHYDAILRIEEGSIVADIVPKHADYESLASELFDERWSLAHAALDFNSRLHGGNGVH